MKFSDESYNLRVELDSKNCELSKRQLDEIEQDLGPLRDLVEKFPVSDLYLTIEHFPRTGRYEVRAALQLPGRGLATGGAHDVLQPAVRECLWRLVQKLTAYEDELGGVEEATKREKGTRQDVLANREVDSDAVRAAVEAGDYAAFRKLMFPYEDALEKRVDRWMDRYPQLEDRMREHAVRADIVEEVFLSAFDQFDKRPQAVPFNEWLEGLIDPSFKLLSSASEEELQNVSFARTLWEG